VIIFWDGNGAADLEAYKKVYVVNLPDKAEPGPAGIGCRDADPYLRSYLLE
jgi:hypothetical protein